MIVLGLLGPVVHTLHHEFPTSARNDEPNCCNQTGRGARRHLPLGEPHAPFFMQVRSKHSAFQ